MEILLPNEITSLNENGKLSYNNGVFEGVCAKTRCKIFFTINTTNEEKIKEGEYNITNAQCPALDRKGSCSYKENRGNACHIKPIRDSKFT